VSKPPITTLGLQRRAQYASDLGPFDARTDGMWSIVRSQEPAEYRRAGETIRRQGMEANAIVYACVRVIADQIGTAHLEAYRLEAEQTTVLEPDGSLQALLDAAGFGFRRTTALHLLLYGNSYTLIKRTNGRPTGLRVIHPERLQQVIVNEETDEIAGYVWNTNAGTQIISPWTDIIHIPDMLVDPDQYFGFPRGLAALYQMVTDTEASKYVRQVLNNSGVPALVFFARQATSMEDLKKAEASWNERMTQRGERGTTRFLGGVEQMQVVGHTLKDLEFPSLRQISREDICAAFGVDPRLIGAASAKGNEGGLSGSQYQEARRRLEQQTCHPLRIAIQDGMDRVLTPEFGDLYARFSPDAISAIVETPTELAERVAVLVAARVMTLDEARRSVGLQEVMLPGHLTEAAMLQTVQDALNATEEAGNAGDDSEGAADGGDATVGDADGVAGERSHAARPLPPADRPDADQRAAPVALRYRSGDDATAFSDEDLDAAWAAFDEHARTLEVEVAALAMDAFADMQDYVLAALEMAQPNDDTVRATRNDPPWWARFLSGVSTLFSPDGPIMRLWKRRLGPAIRSITERAAESLLPGAREDARVRAAIQRRIDAVAENVTATTLKRLQEALAAARAARLSAADTAALVRQVLAQSPNLTDMAMRIARTEVVGAINDGEYAAAMRGLGEGRVRVKAWLSQRDQRVRHSHTVCDGQGWIDAEAAFSNGLLYPHDPNGPADEVVNCRCVLRYADRPLE
jgi:HK97 family phage portal protein